MASYSFTIPEIDYLITKDKILDKNILELHGIKEKKQTDFNDAYNSIIIKSKKSKLFVKHRVDMDIDSINKFIFDFMTSCQIICQNFNGQSSINLKIQYNNIYAEYRTNESNTSNILI